MFAHVYSAINTEYIYVYIEHNVKCTGIELKCETYSVSGVRKGKYFLEVERNCFCASFVWAQVSAKLLNLKGLCVDYISCVLLSHIQTILYQRICTTSSFCMSVSRSFKASSIKTQSHYMSYVIFQYIIYHIIFSLYFLFFFKSIKHS